MKILLISYADSFAGGEKMAATLYEQYKKNGHESFLAVGSKRGNNPDIIEIPYTEKVGLLNKIWKIVEKKTTSSNIYILRQQRVQSLIKLLCLHPLGIIRFLSGEEYYNYPHSRKILDLIPKKPDIVHCHSLRGYFDLSYLPDLSRQIPLVMTLHAPWPITGQCNPPFDCEEWQHSCNPCKYPSKFPHYLKYSPEKNLKRKKEIYSQMSIGVISPSQWLLDMAKKSVLAPAIKHSRVIPNGVDIDIFKPSDVNQCRINLGLPLNTPVILFTAQGVKNNNMKDFSTLYKALQLLSKKEDIKEILCIAIHGTPTEERIGLVTLKILGYISDKSQLIQYFQASDIYVHPARSDNFPTTILEAMACGKPVIASSVAGIPEIIDHGMTGFLVPPQDPIALAKVLIELINNNEKREVMGINARKKVENNFNLEKMTLEHIQFYEEIIRLKNSN